MGKGIPRNPMINAGAILINDVLVATILRVRMQSLTLRSLWHEDVYADHEVHESEKDHGLRCFSHLMKSLAISTQMSKSLITISGNVRCQCRVKIWRDHLLF